MNSELTDTRLERQDKQTGRKKGSARMMLFSLGLVLFFFTLFHLLIVPLFVRLCVFLGFCSFTCRHHCVCFLDPHHQWKEELQISQKLREDDPVQREGCSGYQPKICFLANPDCILDRKTKNHGIWFQRIGSKPHLEVVWNMIQIRFLLCSLMSDSSVTHNDVKSRAAGVFVVTPDTLSFRSDLRSKCDLSCSLNRAED